VNKNFLIAANDIEKRMASFHVHKMGR